MKLWDSKDVRIIAMAINDVAPENKAGRADLILASALEAGVTHRDLKDAAERYWQYLSENDSTQGGSSKTADDPSIRINWSRG